jgi:hypothetical protein
MRTSIIIMVMTAVIFCCEMVAFFVCRLPSIALFHASHIFGPPAIVVGTPFIYFITIPKVRTPVDYVTDIPNGFLMVSCGILFYCDSMIFANNVIATENVALAAQGVSSLTSNYICGQFLRCRISNLEMLIV